MCKPSRVVKNVQKEFGVRNAALENESYILRRHTYPPFNVSIAFKDDDLILTKCRNHHSPILLIHQSKQHIECCD